MSIFAPGRHTTNSLPQDSRKEDPRSQDSPSRAVDLACVALLLLLAAIIILLRNSAVPMQLWDESRNANNAIEMAHNGHWIATYFNGAPDRWATKPPLYTWFAALLLRTGLPPLLALRLPSMAAATATVLLVFFFCRYCLQDRLAGLIAGLTLLAAPIFVGWHAARTGDLDSFVTLFVLVYTLGFWAYLEAHGPVRTRWMAVTGLAIALAVLTKGVGGILALPGLLLYIVVRRRIGEVLLDPRLWLAMLGVALVCGGYYGLREHFDPGYLAAVWRNDFTGRYLAVNEEHQGGPLFYVWTLATKYEPGFILLPFAVVPFFRPGRRRSITLLCILTAGVLFAVITKSQTKIFWYITPATPLLALATSIGLSDGLEWLRVRRQTLPVLFRPRVAYAAVGAIFCLALLATIYYYQIGVEKKLAGVYMEGRYGPFLEQVRYSGLTKRVLILDYGLMNAGAGSGDVEMTHYSPEADFYAKVENLRGMHVQVIVPGNNLPGGSWIATCDPRSNAWLIAHYDVTVALRPNTWCELAQIRDRKTASLAQ